MDPAVRRSRGDGVHPSLIVEGSGHFQTSRLTRWIDSPDEIVGRESDFGIRCVSILGVTIAHGASHPCGIGTPIES